MLAADLLVELDAEPRPVGDLEVAVLVGFWRLHGPVWCERKARILGRAIAAELMKRYRVAPLLTASILPPTRRASG